jgi:hypothetical protein
LCLSGLSEAGERIALDIIGLESELQFRPFVEVALLEATGVHGDESVLDVTGK